MVPGNLTKEEYQKIIAQSGLDTARAIKLKEMSGAAVAEFEFNLWDDLFSGSKYKTKEARVTKLKSRLRIVDNELRDSERVVLKNAPYTAYNDDRYRDYKLGKTNSNNSDTKDSNTNSGGKVKLKVDTKSLWGN